MSYGTRPDPADVVGSTSKAPRMVVLRALKLGDLLVAVPALRALRRAFPEHHIQLATPAWLAPVVTLTGAVDELVPTPDLRPLTGVAPEPEVAVNLHGSGPQSSRVLDALRPHHRIGHRGAGWDGPEWVDGMHERLRWCRLLQAHGVPADPGDLLLAPPRTESPAPGAVVVHPGAAYGSKCWPAPRFAEVARALAADGHRVVVTGSASEVTLARQVAAAAGLGEDAVLAGRTGLDDLCALVAGAGLVVAGDTGIAHLSYAYRTPSVVLFGPVPADRWGPPASGPHVTLSAAELRRGEPFADDPDPALLGVPVSRVVAAARELLDNTGAFSR